MNPPLPSTIFLSEYISEDTNPWDSRERYGIFSTFDKAAESVKWLSDYDEKGQWAETDTYGGSNHGKLVYRCWKWCDEPDEDGDYEDDGGGYGIYIWEEYLDGGLTVQE
jgi:hypothetical protein